MANLKFSPKSYEEAAKVLGFRDSIVIGHNTELHRQEDESIVATYHGNKIVRYSREGVYATYAGWATSTTTNRLNQLAPARFNIKNREPQINGETLEDWSGWVKVS
jgi:hypothetical protein